MADEADMPDSMPIVRAMDHPMVMDSMLDTVPGGEMARGDSAATTTLMRNKLDH